MKEIRTGTIRERRSNAGVLKDQFQIDQHSFTDLLGYISEFLKDINYYNLENEKEGYWHDLVENDPVFLMATIINHPIDTLQHYANYYSEIRTEQSEKLDIVDALMAWGAKIKHWEDLLRALHEDVLANKIKNVFTDVLNSVFEQLRKTTANPGMLFYRPEPQEGTMPLGKVLLIFIKVVMLIQDATKTHLQRHLYSRSDHQPHTAMYITFVLLFKKFQANVNALSQKHLDFYYRQVLQELPGQGKDSSAIVYFKLLPNVENTRIPGDLKLSAGKLFGSKEELYFYTKKPFVAYSIGIEEINTLFFNYSKVIDVGVSEPLISSVTKNNVWNDGKKRSDIKDWKLFGAGQYAQWDANINPDKIAAFGFVVQSPALLLEEGYRSITLKINLDENARNTLWKYIDEIATNRSLMKSTVIAEIFESGLDVSYSSDLGWENAGECMVTGTEEENSISINFKLDISAPAVATFKKDNTLEWPALKMMLNPYAPVYLYSFLKGINVKSIEIKVDVKGVRKLSLYNNVSKITPGKPFDLFGPRPEKGSYFMVGKPELFIKKIDALDVQLNWLSLPTEEGGFTSYYNNYSYPFENSSFQLTPQVLQNGVWNTLETQTTPLFNEKSIVDKGGYAATVLEESTDFTLPVNELDWVNPSAVPSPLVYGIDSISGFFKFVLSSPDPGFGFDLYQKDFTQVALANAKNKTEYAYPNKPISPKISDIVVNYSASDTLTFEDSLSEDAAINRGVFQHITPFTTENIIKDRIVNGSKLLFDYQNEAYFFMGLTNVVEETTVSVYFQLFTINQVADTANRKITWEYFNVNRWEKLKESNIILDGTSGFLKSGIIELTLPKATAKTLAAHNNIYWLRVSTNTQVASYPKVKGIYMNAAEVYARDTPPELRGKVVPNGSISKIVTKHPFLKGVAQPGFSRGGIAVETQDEYYLRVSERLRHKGRAVSIWDYEHLILQRFASVFAVKCTNLNENFEPVPGKVNVIVLSKHWTNKNRYYYNSDQLIEMENYLKPKTNQFVQLKVVNPVEEYLLVNVAVRFNKDDVGGYYLNQLNTDIVSFLSPNSYVENGLAGIGGSISRSSIISFIQNLDYIADVKYMSVEHIIVKGGNRYLFDVHEDNREIRVSSPGAMLISVEQHNIQILSSNDDVIMKPGIGEMEVGLDLILANKDDSCDHDDEAQAAEEKSEGNDSIFVFKKSRKE